MKSRGSIDNLGVPPRAGWVAAYLCAGMAALGAASGSALADGSGSLGGQASAATPTITIFSNSGGSQTLPPYIPFSILNLGSSGTANTLVTQSNVTATSSQVSLPSGSQIAQIAFGNGNTQSGVYAGSVLSDSGSPFGAADTTTDYLAAGGRNGTVTVSYSQSQTSLNMLWGVLNSGNSANLITFTSASGATVATVNGSQIGAGLPSGSGFNSSSSTVALNLSNIAPFTSVTFSDTKQHAFELALGTGSSTLAFGGRGLLPEPASFALLGTALGGLALLRRLKKIP